VALPADEFVDAFAHHASGTRRRMRHQLSKSLRELAALGATELWQVTEETVAAWCAELRSALAPSTAESRVRLFARFTAWLVERGRLLADPVPAWLAVPSAPYPYRPVPSEGDVASLLATAQHSRAWYPLRNLAIVELLYGCGLRCGELCGLDLADFRGASVRVRGKGGKERMVPVAAAAREAVELYVRTERAAVLGKRDVREVALFLGAKGARLTTGGVVDMFRKQLGTPLRAHRLRHACATHMLRNGAGIVVLRDLLGHEGIATTRIYTEVLAQDVRKAVEKFHPRG